MKTLKNIQTALAKIQDQLMTAKTVSAQRLVLDQIYSEYASICEHHLESININNLLMHWIMPTVIKSDKVVLFLHGGGFTLGSTQGHLGLLTQLAKLTGCKILSVDYRLAPEHPFPAAIDDTLAAYNYLSNHVASDNIILVGLTAGANLALSLLISLKAKQQAMPATGILLSLPPRLDFADNPKRYQNQLDWINYTRAQQVGQSYLEKHDPKQVLASPYFADLTGLPPLLIQMGTHEILYQDAVEFHQLALKYNVNSKFESYPGMVHAWHMFPALFPEAKESMNNIVRYLEKTT